MKTFLVRLVLLLVLLAAIAFPYFTDPAFAVIWYGLMALTFGIIIALKIDTTKIWTIALIASIAAMPLPARAEPPPKKDPQLIAIAITAAIVGGIGAWVIWKVAQRIPTPPAPPPPPPTNYPNINVNPTRTNRPTIRMGMIANDAHGITARDISAHSIPDTVSGGTYHTYWFTQVQCSEDLCSWRESLTVTGYMSTAGQHVGFWSNGVCLYNAYVTTGTTNYDIPIEQGSLEPGRKFFRAVAP